MKLASPELSSHHERRLTAALTKSLSKLAAMNVVIPDLEQAPAKRPEHVQRVLDLRKEEIDQRLSHLCSAALTAEQLNGEVPERLIEDIHDTAELLIHTQAPEDLNQLAVVALADAYHFTDDTALLEPALEAIEENPIFEDSVNAPLVEAIKLVAESGMSAHDAWSHTLPQLPPQKISAVNKDTHSALEEPLGPEYDNLFHPTDRWPGR